MQEKMKAERGAKESSVATATPVGGLGTSASAIATDSACAGSSIWLYDQLNRVGNQLCLVGSGTLDLSTICAQYSNIYDPFGRVIGSYCSKYWFTPSTSSSAIRSYWPGAARGSILEEPAGACAQTCTAWDDWGMAVDYVSCGAKGRWLEQAVWGRACWLDQSAYSLYDISPNGHAYDWTEQVQGMAHDDSYFYITQRYLDLTGSGPPVIRRVGKSNLLSKDLNFAPRVYVDGWPDQHYGDPDKVGDRIYIPLEDGAPVALTPALGVLNWPQTAETPTIVGRAPITDSEDNSASWVAVDPRDNLIYMSNFGDTGGPGVTELRAYQLVTSPTFRLNLVKRVPLKNPDGTAKTLWRMQGGAFSSSGHLYLVSDDVVEAASGIFGVDVESGRVHLRIGIPHTPGSDELEGLTIDLAHGVYGGGIHTFMNQITYPTDGNVYWHHAISDGTKL